MLFPFFTYPSILLFLPTAKSKASTHKRKLAPIQRALHNQLSLEILNSTSLKKTKVSEAPTPKKAKPPKPSSKQKKSTPPASLDTLRRSVHLHTKVPQCSNPSLSHVDLREDTIKGKDSEAADVGDLMKEGIMILFKKK